MHSQCQTLQEKALKMIPGMVQLLSKRPDLFSMGSWPTYYNKAKGAFVWDCDGRKYIDMSVSGLGACTLGYADEDINTAVIKAINNGNACSLNSELEVHLAEKLVAIHPWAHMARFAKAGGEAMAIAVRIARTATKKNKVIFCGYHGWQDWYLAANLKDTSVLDQHLLEGLAPQGVPKQLAGTAIPFLFNDISSFDRAMEHAKDDLAAIVMEPLRNEFPNQDFIQHIRSSATQASVPLIIDEISAGFRFCFGGAHLKFGLEPDMAVFAKGLGNGFPIAAIIGNDAFMSHASSSFISSTNWTESIGYAAALATIEKFLKYKVWEHIDSTGREVQKRWKQVSMEIDLPIEIGGLPPFGHFAFQNDQKGEKSALFIQEMLQQGFLACGKFYPMLAHTPDQLESYTDALHTAFKKIKDTASPTQFLKGQPTKRGFARLN